MKQNYLCWTIVTSHIVSFLATMTEQMLVNCYTEQILVNCKARYFFENNCNTRVTSIFLSWLIWINAKPLIRSCPIDARRYVFKRLSTLPDCSHPHEVTAAVSAILRRTDKFGYVSSSHFFSAFAIVSGRAETSDAVHLLFQRITYH